MVGRTGKDSGGFLGEKLKGIERGFWKHKNSKSPAREDFINFRYFRRIPTKVQLTKSFFLFKRTEELFVSQGKFSTLK